MIKQFINHQAREAVYYERLQCDKDLSYKLAALALQEIRGDYTTEEAAMKTLTKYNLLSPGASSAAYLEVSPVQSRSELAFHMTKKLKLILRLFTVFYTIKQWAY